MRVYYILANYHIHIAMNPKTYVDPNTGHTFTEGDGALVHNRKVNNLGTFLGWLIRIIQGVYWNHMVTFAIWQDELWIYEATERGVMPTRSVKDWLEQNRNGYRNYRVLDHPLNEVELAIFRHRLKEVQGKGYDFMSLLYFHPLRLMLERWFRFIKPKRGTYLGHTSDHAKKNWYCSELYGYLRSVKSWWIMTPEDMNKQFKPKFTYIYGVS